MVSNLRDAVNDVLPGIRFQGQLLSNGTYKICSQCTETIKEYSNYLWDEKASRTGDEKPIKKFDHCSDAQRYILFTQFFNKPHTSMTEAEANKLEEEFRLKF